VFAAIGTAVSGYLTWLHYSGSLALCIGVGGCEAVQTSRFSMLGSVPVAALGLAGFVGMLLLAVARLSSSMPGLDLALFMLSFGATLYVVYLSYVEVFVLGAICPWCVSVAVCAVAILAFVGWDLLSPRRS
jgi:uncharacterized membrane protein